MGLPVAKLLTLATSASGFAVVGAMCGEGSYGGALAGVVSGVLGNFFATLFQPAFDPSGDTPDVLIRNHDLRHLTGIAIRDTILLEKVDPDRAAKLAGGAVDLWMSEATAADASLDRLKEQAVVGHFVTDQVSFDAQTTLDVETWRAFLATLAKATETEVPDELGSRLAKTLHEKLPQMLRAIAKKDFRGATGAGGSGFASLQLALLGRIVEGVDKLVESQTLSAESVEQIRRFNANLPAAAERTFGRVRPADRQAMSHVLEKINQLRPHLDRRLDEILRAVAAEGQVVQKRVRVVDRKLTWGLAVAGVLCVIGLVGWGLNIAAHRAGTAGTDRVSAQLTDVDAKLTEMREEWTREKPQTPTSPPSLSDEDRAFLEETKRHGTQLQRARALALEGNSGEAQREFARVDRQRMTEEPFRYFTTEGDIAALAGKYKDAIPSYETALKLHPASVATRVALAGCHSMTVDFDQPGDQSAAIRVLEEGLPLANQPADRARLDAALGRHLAFRNNPDGSDAAAALEALGRAAAVFTEQTDPETYADLQKSIAGTWAGHPTAPEATKYRMAGEAYERAKQVYTLGAHPAERAMLLNNQAKFVIGTDPRLAIKLLEEGVHAFRESYRLGSSGPPAHALASMLGMLGAAHLHLGHPASAVPQAREAVKVWEALSGGGEKSALMGTVNQVMLVEAYTLLGRALRETTDGPRRGNLLEARDVYVKLLKLSGEGSVVAGRAHVSLGAVLVELGFMPDVASVAMVTDGIGHAKAGTAILKESAPPDESAAAARLIEETRLNYEKFSWAKDVPFDSIKPAK